MLKTFKIVISGQVQGVGFRPFVYVLAQKYGLVGFVSNNEEGVIIRVSGHESDIRNFYRDICSHPPPVARIRDHSLSEQEYAPYDEFLILPSEKSRKLNLQLTPDFGICDNCAEEITDPKNRRFQYPFTTCVHCGPRWSVTNTFPFERDHTTIGSFVMCDACLEEYDDPLDRRFHSQTNSCGACGPHLDLYTVSGENLGLHGADLFKKTASLIEEGRILAVKNTGGYLLCCDAGNPEAVKRLREKKFRPGKPFALLFPSLENLESACSLNESQRKALLSVERPIVIVSKKGYRGSLAGEEVAPHLSQLGVMLPYSSILRLIAEQLHGPIVATSGNLHGSPIISDRSLAEELLGSVADYFVHHDLPITNAQDDSVVKISFRSGQEVLFRRSRGYAPNCFDAGIEIDERVMALGSHLKSSIAFVPNDFLYISQYLGHLDHFDVYQRFCATAAHFIRVFEQEPEVVLVDAHPEYLSTRYGEEMHRQWGARLVKIQHHKAHFAAVLGEHHLFGEAEPVLGVIWDGTGLGDDGQIWGGEFFKYEGNQMERAGHIAYYDWLAADKMAREPRLSLLSLSDDSMEPVLGRKFTAEELAIYKNLKVRNKLKTSSVGRLFDAVASYLDVCDLNTYEGEAAIRLENVLDDYDLGACEPYTRVNEEGTLSAHDLLIALARDAESGAGRLKLVGNFLFTLAKAIMDRAGQLGIRKIACSGGVFQNTTLVDMIKDLSPEDTQIYFNRNLAPNDENIAYGQVMYYHHVMKRQDGAGKEFVRTL